jgi:hypothetical protein
LDLRHHEVVFDSGLLLFVADELLDRNAGSARQQKRMAKETDADGAGAGRGRALRNARAIATGARIIANGFSRS